ncbi:MAG: hypothetical protein L7S45_07295 [Luminiphilus sp.]|nr:hypothetical protein [Luminiphilus sp.]
MSDGVGYPVNRVVANALDKSLRTARTRHDRANIRSLVMYSGGLDSVALLANVLAETEHHVHVHHIEIVNRDGRSEIENIAVEKTLDYIRREYRDFDYSSSRNEFNVGWGGGTDLQLAFTAGRLTTALEGMVDIVFTGHIQPPFWELSEGAAILNAVFIQRKQKPEWLWPLSKIDGAFGMRKVHIWESIPPELAEMTWSCRRPVMVGDDIQVCNDCHACTSRANLREKLSGRTPSWESEA